MKDLSSLKSKVIPTVPGSESPVLGLIFLLSVTLAISLYCLRTSPGFWFDEGIYYQIVENWARTGSPGALLEPGVKSDLSLISVGYSVFYPAVIVFKLFGASVLAMRLTAVVFLLGFVTVFYILAERLYGRTAAFWSALLLATFSPLYGNGKSFLGEVPGLLYFLLGLFFISRQETKPALLNLFAAGIGFGLAVSSKPIYILILPAVVLALLINWRQWFGSRSGLSGLGVLVLGLAGPVFLWVGTQFGAEVSATRILTHYSNPYYFSDWTLVILGNLKRFVTETTPAHFLLLLILALVYLAYKLTRRERPLPVEAMVLSFCLLVALAYLRTLGWYRNFFPAHALLFLFSAVGLAAVGDRLQKWSSRGQYALPVAALALLAAQLFPLSSQALSCKIDAPTAVEPLLGKNLSSGAPVLFYSVPQIAARSGLATFYQYIKMSDQLSLGAENLPRLKNGFFQTVVIEEAATRGQSVVPSCYELKNTTAGIQFYSRRPGVNCL